MSHLLILYFVFDKFKFLPLELTFSLLIFYDNSNIKKAAIEAPIIGPTTGIQA